MDDIKDISSQKGEPYFTTKHKNTIINIYEDSEFLSKTVEGKSSQNKDNINNKV